MAEIAIYGTDGKNQGTVKIDLTQKKLSQKTFACAIRVLRQNWRQGTVKCKTRAELAFSNRKPWKQKGTGRARAGTLRSPLWRKGGVVFGPQPRSRMLGLNSKQKNLVFNNLFQEKLEKKAIFCLDLDVQTKKPNTKSAVQILTASGLKDKNILLFVSFNDIASIASFRNIPNVHIMSFDQPNAFDLANKNCWVFLKKDNEHFKEMVSQWN